MAKIFKVFVELYELFFTTRKDDRSGRVVSTGSIKIGDIIAIATGRRSDINAATMLAVYQILREVALEEVCNAKNVEFGLTHNHLGVDGVFIGDHPTWDKLKDRLVLDASACADVRKAIESIDVEILGMASSGMFINTLIDVTSSEINERITPGGGVNLTGVKIKIAGDAAENGIYLTDINSEIDTKIATNAILINDPSKISFIVPADLPAGDYKLKITTQYASSGGFLKDPRTYVFDYVLECN
jgi:hypothetical protein